MLDDLTIRNAKAADKPYKLFDEKGLFLLVNPSGTRLWRLKYRYAGKEKLLAFGAYPEVSLKNARLRRDDARAMLRKGATRPPTGRWQSSARLKKGPKWSERHRARALSRLEQNVFPYLGNRPIDQIEPPELLAVLRKIEARGAYETALRVRVLCSQVFRYGIAELGLCKRDPTVDLRGVLTSPVSSRMPVIPTEELPQLLTAIDGCEEAPACRDRQTRLGLQFLALVFTRTTEVRKAMWEQVSLEERIWMPAPETMKMRRPHIVPLSRQAIAVLQELREITGSSKLLFPGEGRKRIMSENTLLFALYALGYRGRMCGRGFRSLASTILNGSLHFDEDWIELQLAHQYKNKVRGTYNHWKYLDERTEMMQWYADYLDELRKGKYILPKSFPKLGKPALELAA